MQNRQCVSRKISFSYSATTNEVIYPEEYSPTVIVMVGLPARGKTYMSTKIARYLNWIGISTRVFNVGQYRRRALKEQFTAHDFFRPDNQDALTLRQEAAENCFDDMARWLLENRNDIGSKIGVFDATNTTKARRDWIFEKCKQQKFNVFFVESICTKNTIIEDNVKIVKINGPDYAQCENKESVISDFMARIKHYESAYEPLDIEDSKLSFIKIFNIGERYIVNNLDGNLQSRIVYYLMNCKVINHRTIYITRHGETEYNVKGRIGGDSKLTAAGQQYADKLAAYMQSEPNSSTLNVWTSLFDRTITTAAGVQCLRKQHWKALNEIDAGVCEGMTYEEIAATYPQDFAKRDVDKYQYRYPSGESYQDLVARLEPVIMELERQDNVLLVCHQAVARCLLAYFLDKKHDELPYLRVPLHTVIKLSPVAYGCIVENIKLDIPAVDTHRTKPENLNVSRTTYDALQTVPSHQ